MTYVCPKARGLGSKWRHKQRLRLHALQCGLCHWCGTACSLWPPRGGQLTVDHVVPVHAGGSHEDCNLVGACLACNCKRGNEYKRRKGMKERVVEMPEITYVYEEGRPDETRPFYEVEDVKAMRDKMQDEIDRLMERADRAEAELAKLRARMAEEEVKRLREERTYHGPSLRDLVAGQEGGGLK